MPKNLGLQHILLLLRFFTFFLENSKKRDFLGRPYGVTGGLITFFCFASHVFSNYARNTSITVPDP